MKCKHKCLLNVRHMCVRHCPTNLVRDVVSPSLIGLNVVYFVASTRRQIRRFKVEVTCRFESRLLVSDEERIS